MLLPFTNQKHQHSPYISKVNETQRRRRRRRKKIFIWLRYLDWKNLCV